ncbi:hypothetical protein GF323_00650 [Candidatus Woesearchaeota archaeon]|nr:hypothetical protein [Candidatus Woesearchaeota archaeon]
MNRRKILDMSERDFLTIANLERSMHYVLKSGKGRAYQFRIMHAAFKRACDIMLKRRKHIAKELGLKLIRLKDPD